MKPIQWQRLLFAHDFGHAAPTAVGCYLAFKVYTSGDANGWTRASQYEIAEACGIARNTAAKALRTLAGAGFIIESKQIVNGRHRPSKYLLTNPTERPAQTAVPCATTAHGVGHGVAHGVGHGVEPLDAGDLSNVRSTESLLTALPAAASAADDIDPTHKPTGHAPPRPQADEARPDNKPRGHHDGHGPTPLHHRCPHPTCRAPIGRPCKGLPPGKHHAARTTLADQQLRAVE